MVSFSTRCRVEPLRASHQQTSYSYCKGTVLENPIMEERLLSKPCFVLNSGLCQQLQSVY